MSVSAVETSAFSAEDEVAVKSHLTSVALHVKDVTKSYKRNDIPVLKGVSFDIPAGQSVALIGANGCGKSTLLKCCLGLVDADGGDIHIYGKTIVNARGKQLRDIRKRSGLVFQKHNLVPQLSVLTNVLHGGIARGLGARVWFQALAPQSERDRAMECLDKVGLSHLANRNASGLSGGQSQRVAIARALMQDPDILFADEPVASLDPAAGKGIMELFAKLQRDNGLTIVFVSHHIDHALDYADRILGMKQGHVIVDARSRECSSTDFGHLYES